MIKIQNSGHKQPHLCVEGKSSSLKTRTEVPESIGTTPIPIYPPHGHYTQTSSLFHCLLHTALAPTCSRSLTGWHVKTVIFRHTYPAVCWLFSWYHGDSKRVSGEQGAGLGISSDSLIINAAAASVASRLKQQSVHTK